MLVRVTISILAVCWCSSAFAQSSSEASPRSDALADTVWSYIVDTCPPAALGHSALNEELYRLLGEPLTDDSSPILGFIEARGRDIMVNTMSDLDKRTMGTVFVGSQGVLHQLNFMNAVANDEHLAAADYLEQEATLHLLADTSLQLMECLWPSVGEVMEPQTESGWGEQGQQLWIEMAKSIYTASCETDFFKLATEYLEADFAAVQPADRKSFVAELTKRHEDYLEAEQIAETCEDFS
ncbi:hypothetical protein SLH49_16330 [Cognatiyoonia sp. IB215446]|uniref:hypothetical protein n=1 Tax=Cognatiyoonia sp. IB215446 TaxID=3097355 RepID=UPI002A11C91A|nr:hypothetical protein [Cognatiyoonia sp. IB215446]MDX8349552.1 hypothetical protein [Cognatiyoonia sp. IB215446]